MSKKLIIIHGAPGIGKTTTCQRLRTHLTPSVWLDADWCWMMHPFTVTRETKQMVEDNITHLLRNFLQHDGFEYVIFNWVIHREEIFELILSKLADLEFDLHKLTLICTEESLRQRMIQAGRDAELIQRSVDDLRLFVKMDTVKVDTTHLTLDQTVERIVKIVHDHESF